MAAPSTYLKDCCASPMKFYIAISCRLCWECQNCRTHGCDKVMYQMNNSTLLRDKFLKTEFLKAYGVTESTGRYERPGPGANPGRLKPGVTGPDCSVVIMKVHEKVCVRVKEPVNIYTTCDNPDVRHTFYRQWDMGKEWWTCRIGPIDKPLVTTITIDNHAMPLIVTE